MNAPDTLKRLEGEPEIPSLTPRGGASSHKPIIAASVLILSLVGALGFAATRYFGKKEAPPEAAVDVASATVTKLKFQDPPVVVPAPVPAVKANPVVDQTPRAQHRGGRHRAGHGHPGSRHCGWPSCEAGGAGR